MRVQVIGGGLAGTEAAWQIAQAGVPVTLHEMRPHTLSPAHHSQELAELVCSNSFGAQSADRAAGLLHEELRRLGSIIIGKADHHAVPAGGALAVDRGQFSHDLTVMRTRFSRPGPVKRSASWPGVEVAWRFCPVPVICCANKVHRTGSASMSPSGWWTRSRSGQRVTCGGLRAAVACPRQLCATGAR